MKTALILNAAALVTLAWSGTATAMDHVTRARPPAPAILGAPDPGGTERIGFCDSTSGCIALERACASLEGHAYAPTAGGGVCTEQSPGTSGWSLSATGFQTTTLETADATCFGQALCRALRASCQGVWDQDVSGTYGICKD